MKSDKHLKLHHELLHFGIALLVLVLLIAMPMSRALAQTTVQNPQTGSIGISGVIEGEPPSEAAVITRPARGETFSANPIQVSGTCLEGLLVQIYRNDTFAGSTVCLEDGTFSLQIDLVNGPNNLYARVFDGLNQEGPRSSVVDVTYTPSVDQGVDVGTGDSGSGTGQFLLTSNFSAFGVDPKTELNWPINISGGTPPYALSWDWGDGTTDLFSVADSGTYDGATHSYNLAGTYRVIIKATDADGRLAYLELIAVVNGEAAAGITQTSTGAGPAVVTQYIRWPLYILGGLLVPAFVVGRRFEHRQRDMRYRQQRERQALQSGSFGGQNPAPQH